MSRQFSRDYDTDINLGLIPGRSRTTIVGHDPTVPSGGPFGLSPSFGINSYLFDQSAISATPAVVGVASTDNTNDNAAGTGALTVAISGLDASGDAQSENVTMTGQTAALTTATFSAVFTVVVLTTGANNANIGTIYVGTGTFTAGVPAVRMLSMEIGSNISRSAYYVVPNGKVAVMKHFGITVASTNKDAEVHVEISDDGILWRSVFPFGSGSGSFNMPVLGAETQAAGEHIKMVAHGGAASTDVTAYLVLEIIDV
jgi:hypothetical protein